MDIITIVAMKVVDVDGIRARLTAEIQIRKQLLISLQAQPRGLVRGHSDELRAAIIDSEIGVLNAILASLKPTTSPTQDKLAGAARSAIGWLRGVGASALAMSRRRSTTTWPPSHFHPRWPWSAADGVSHPEFDDEPDLPTAR